ncbi:MAG: ATP-binding domain-containing protein, partial [Deltaproteobacteria bacterium]|nr:ATP-binding domain-containing protein [Deltaproteobacteria bacterium]
IQCVPTGAGEKTIKNMQDIAFKNGADILTALKTGLFSSIRGLNNMQAQTIYIAPASFPAAVPDSSVSGIANYFDVILKIKSEIESAILSKHEEAVKIGNSDIAAESESGSGPNSGDRLADIINFVYKASGYESMLKAGVSKANELDGNRIENIEELINASHDFGDITEFLDQSAINDTKEEPNARDGSDITKVSLMTLHSSKGLEFPVVFIAGLEEHLFPHIRSLDNESSLEEERRLCYVGITRAKEKLYLTWSKKRRSGKDYKYNMPSRFLREIPEELIEEIVDTYEYY